MLGDKTANINLDQTVDSRSYFLKTFELLSYEQRGDFEASEIYNKLHVIAMCLNGKLV